MIVSKFLPMTALADLLIGDSTLVLYFSGSRTRSPSSAIVPIFQNLSLFSVYVESIFEYCGNDTIKQDINCFKALESWMLI